MNIYVTYLYISTQYNNFPHPPQFFALELIWDFLDNLQAMISIRWKSGGKSGKLH